MGDKSIDRFGRAMGRVLLDAGTETSASFLHSFVMAMVCYPEVQLKAQAEIDQVLGGDQLPVLEDYSSLPYLNALIKEASKPTSHFYTVSDKYQCCSSTDSGLSSLPAYLM